MLNFKDMSKQDLISLLEKIAEDLKCTENARDSILYIMELLNINPTGD